MKREMQEKQAKSELKAVLRSLDFILRGTENLYKILKPENT